MNRALSILVLVVVMAVTVIAAGGYLPKILNKSTPAPGIVSETPDYVLAATKDPGRANFAYVVDNRGRTLYVFANDKPSQSTCVDTCAKNWPPFLFDGRQVLKTTGLETHLRTIKRADGSQQYTFDGHPMYYYAADKKAGDIKGDGLNSVWSTILIPLK